MLRHYSMILVSFLCLWNGSSIFLFLGRNDSYTLYWREEPFNMAGIAPPVLTRMTTGDGEGFLGQQRRLLSEPLLEICQEPVQGCLLHGEASPKLMTTEYNGFDSLWFQKRGILGVWTEIIGLEEFYRGIPWIWETRLRALCSLAVGFPPERGSSSYSGAPARPTAQFTFLKWLLFRELDCISII